VLFDLKYERCVGGAEQVALEFNRSQIPEGAKRLELASSFDSCLTDIGLDKPTYDPNAADEVALLAEVTIELGYELGDQSVADDPRFVLVIECFQSHELLFPSRFGSDS